MPPIETVFQCPRRRESSFGNLPAFARDNDYDGSDDSCRYCGSLNPKTFMSRLEAGDVELGSTDKNYKAYVHNAGGVGFKQTYRDCPKDKRMIGAAGNEYFVSSCEGPDSCTHWVTRDISQAKFYFQHLNQAQQSRFIELYNEHRIKFAGGYGFYVLPFFCRKASHGDNEGRSQETT